MLGALLITTAEQAITPDNGAITMTTLAHKSQTVNDPISGTHRVEGPSVERLADVLCDAERKLEALFDGSTTNDVKREIYATYLHLRLALELVRTAVSL